MKTKRNPTSVRFTPETQQIIFLLGRKLGISQGAVLSLAVRRLAEIEGIELPPPQKQNTAQDQ